MDRAVSNDRRSRCSSLRPPSFTILAASMVFTLPAHAVDRDQVMATAEQYAGHRWVCTAANTKAGCSSSYRSDYSPGTYTGLPYDWGGYKTIEQFDDEIQKGYGAGSHSRHGVLSCTTGVDCSGFVSKCWGVSHHTTRSLPGISDAISKWDVKKGDIFNKPGSHVVLFSHFASSGAPVFYEASGSASKVRLNARGGWRSLNGYTARRYKNIEDGPKFACSEPMEIRSFPFSDTRNTVNSPCDKFDRYSCAPSTRETGPEYVYKVMLDKPGTLAASVECGPGVDIDVHVLSENDENSCLARNDRGLEIHLEAGEYFLSADTYRGASGREYPGGYTLRVDFTPDSEPKPSGKGTVWGVIFEDKGNNDRSTRLTGAKVTVYDTDDTTTASGDQAYWNFELAPGRYTFKAEMDGYYENHRTCDVTGDSTTWCSIGLVRVSTGTMEGVVFEDDGDGDDVPRLEGAKVELAGTGLAAVAEGAEAHWSFESLQPGEYEVKISMPGYAGGVKTCSVIAGETTWCSMGLKPMDKGKIQGTVYEDTGDGDMSRRLPAAGVTVMETGDRTTASDGDAFWSFELDSGMYTVRATLSGYADGERRCEVVPGETTWCSIGLVKKTKGTLKGVVYEDFGNGDMSTRLSSARVQVLENGMTVSASGEQALWSFELDPGDYTVEVSLDGYETGRRTCSVAADETSWCSVGLKRLGGTGELTGVVFKDIGGGDMSVRIPGASVRLVETNAEVSAQGEAALWSFVVPPGRYTVEASMNGYVTGTRECESVSGEVTWCSIGLKLQSGSESGFGDYLQRAANIVLSEDADLGYGSGHSTRDLYYAGEKVFSVKDRTSHCVGMTFEILLVAMNLYFDETGDASVWNMPAGWMKWEPFKHCWYVDPKIGCYGAADAIESYGIGEKVNDFSELKPGDFINYDRTNRTGHSVMFLGYLYDDGTLGTRYNAGVVGFRYVSSQGSTNGVGVKNAFFSGECRDDFDNRDCGIIESSLVMGRVYHPREFVPQAGGPPLGVLHRAEPQVQELDLDYFDDTGASNLP